MIRFRTSDDGNAFVDRIYDFYKYSKNIQNYLKIVPSYFNDKLSQCTVRINDVSSIAAIISKCNGIQYITTDIGVTTNKEILCNDFLELYNKNNETFKNGEIQVGDICEGWLEDLQHCIKILYDCNNNADAVNAIIKYAIEKKENR